MQTEVQDQELTADDIYNSDDLTVSDPVEIPEWRKNDKPGIIYFRVMSADEHIKFQELLKGPTKNSVMVRILALCACNKNGDLLFKPTDMEKLRKKSTVVFNRLSKFLLQLNGMVPPTKTWGAVESILEESGVDPTVIALVKNKWDAPDDTVKND